MPRTVSSEVRALIDSNYAQTYDVVDITLPLKAGETEVNRVNFYLSKSSGITFNGHIYQPLLRAIGTIKFSLGKATDSSEISIENVSHTFGITLSDTTRTLDGATVIIRKLFAVSAGLEGYDLFRGYVRDTKINQELVTLSLISDMSRRSAQVASRVVSQRCIWTFRGVECGWTDDQAGNPLFCNKIFEHFDGCSGHENRPRFGGVPTLSPKAQEIVGGLGSGWDIPDDSWRNRGWRFDLDYPINSGGNLIPLSGNTFN